jgi:hypothetical protein
MSALFIEPEHWIMQMRQFTNLRHRVEGATTAATAAVPATQPPVAVAAMR